MNDLIDIRYSEFITVRAVIDGEDWELEVLGVPYYGTRNGKDSYGTFFSPNTELMISEGESRPVLYYHGLNSNGVMEDYPKSIGVATAIKRDEKGLWFRVILNKSSDYAKRIWEAAQKGLVKASSGAISHLVRIAENTGEILTWAVGEISLIDENKQRKAANSLAVAIPLRSYFEEIDIPLPQEFVKDHESKTNAEKGENKNPNSEAIKNFKMDAKDILEVKNAVLEAMKAEDEAKKAKEDEKNALRAELTEQITKELEAKIPAWKGGFNVKKVTTNGNSNEPKEAFLQWVRTGDDAGIRAAAPLLESGTGDYAVPEDMYSQIVAKRDEISIIRRMGVNTIPTTRDVVDVPVENGEMGAFSPIAENTNVVTSHENEPTLAQVPIKVYTMRNLVLVSEETLADNAAGLEAFINNSFGRKLGEAENKYAVAGAGTTEPEGALVGGTAGLTFDNATAIGVAEIPELLYKLPAPYRDGACWVMHPDTEGYLRGLSISNAWAFNPTPASTVGPLGVETLFNRPLFTTSSMDAIAGDKKTILIGNFNYLGFVERQGLTIRRLTERWADYGMVGLLAVVRFGCAVLQAEAFQYGTQE